MGKEDLLNPPGEESIHLETSDNLTPEPDLWRKLSLCPALCISPDSCHTLSKKGCSELGEATGVAKGNESILESSRLKKTLNIVECSCKSDAAKPTTNLGP